MGIVLIVLGLFLWFALAFNGGVGEPFVNYSFFASALLMIISGVFKTVNPKSKIARIFCAAALITYLPMIWQRFNFKFFTDWGGISFDTVIIVLMLIFIASKPNHKMKADGK